MRIMSINRITNSEISLLCDEQVAFIILVIEKYTGKRYYDLTHVKKNLIVAMLNDIENKLTDDGKKEKKKIFNLLNL
jgi:hypothetical protein